MTSSARLLLENNGGRSLAGRSVRPLRAALRVPLPEHQGQRGPQPVPRTACPTPSMLGCFNTPRPPATRRARSSASRARSCWMMILAIGAGARAIAGEEERGTLDLRFKRTSSPRRRAVSRWRSSGRWSRLRPAFRCRHVGISRPCSWPPVRPSDQPREPQRLRWSSTVLLALGFGTAALAMGCWRGKRGLADRGRSSVAVVTYLLNVLARL